MLRPALNGLPRGGILFQNRRLCNQNLAPAQHGPPNPDLEIERRVLPAELMRNVVRLTCKSTAEPGVCDVYVVGTCHVSQDSFRDVRAIVNFLKPQVVFLELCSHRTAILSTKTLKIPTTAEMIDMLWKKKHNPLQLFFSWFYAQVGAKLKVLPGSEFRIAFEEASKYGGKVVLGDRPIQVTLQRMGRNMPLWHKIKLAYGLLFIGASQCASKLNKMIAYQMNWGEMPLWHKTKVSFTSLFDTASVPSADKLKEMLKMLDDSDSLTLVIQEIGKVFPTLVETMVYERDRYMSCTLLKVAKEHNLVVAIVGKGHLQGIKKNWGQPVSLEELLEVPKKKPVVSAMKIISGVAVVGLAIIAGR